MGIPHGIGPGPLSGYYTANADRMLNSVIWVMATLIAEAGDEPTTVVELGEGA